MNKDINNIVYNNFQILNFLKIDTDLKEIYSKFLLDLLVIINLVYLYIIHLTKIKFQVPYKKINM